MAKSIEAIQQAVERTFIEKVRQIFDNNLDSVLLYGSFIRGNFQVGISDINILIILDRSEFDQINRFGKECRKLINTYHITPLLLRRQEFLNSADVFPMEYMDLVDDYKVLHGEDVTDKLDLTTNNLRHQLEHHLRGNVNSLRQLITGSEGKTRILGKNLKTSFGSFSSLFRGLLRLKGVTPVPGVSNEVLSLLKDQFSFNTGPFEDLLRFRDGEKTDVDDLASRLLSALQDLVTIVDSMGKST